MESPWGGAWPVLRHMNLLLNVEIVIKHEKGCD